MKLMGWVVATVALAACGKHASTESKPADPKAAVPKPPPMAVVVDSCRPQPLHAPAQPSGIISAGGRRALEKVGGVEAGEPVATGGTLDAASIAKVIKAHSGALRACWDVELSKHRATSGGTITVDFVIGEDGGVTSAKTQGMEGGSVAPCIQRQFTRFKFAKPTGGPVTVTYPITLRVPDEPARNDPEEQPAAALPASPPPPAAPDAAQAVLARLRQQDALDVLAGCYQLGADPNLAGSAVVLIGLAPDGVFATRAYGLGDAKAEHCLAESLQHLPFPAQTATAGVRCDLTRGAATPIRFTAPADAPVVTVDADHVTYHGATIGDVAQLAADTGQLRIEPLAGALAEAEAGPGVIVVQAVPKTDAMVLTRVIATASMTHFEHVVLESPDAKGGWTPAYAALPSLPPDPTAAPAPPVAGSILITKDAIWIGADNDADRTKIDGRDLGALGKRLAALASGPLHGRDGVEVAAETGVDTATVLSVLQLAAAQGFPGSVLVDENAQSVKFRQ